jgi:hypothetical protein
MTGRNIILTAVVAEPHGALRWRFDVGELEVTVQSNRQGLVWDVQWNDRGYRDGYGAPHPGLERALQQRVAEELARARLPHVLADLDRASRAWPDR